MDFLDAENIYIMGVFICFGQNIHNANIDNAIDFTTIKSFVEIHKLLEHVKQNKDIKRVVTLSPLTPMATHFHIRNGAKLIQHNPDTQNFEYTIQP